ncbi:MAG: hypothetical protein AAF541_12800 [Pseudomonadota bacterium]
MTTPFADSRITLSTPILSSPRYLKLFGVGIDNDSMEEAVDWASRGRTHGRGRGQVGVFANAHSFDTMWSHPKLGEALRSADRVFPDGVGVRLAAKQLGVAITANVNGTDMLTPRASPSEVNHWGFWVPSPVLRKLPQ